ncbi:MAG: hypothetical protein OXH10_05805 [bacterium]|nr:hypothetical protein [bacterium]MXX65304.1 hypothetical protein [Acidimicrobiia bacterium]MCY3580476.1 hypothetical protein [bacterium]MDE0644203.1 hypothetical protein [bacterium]MYD03400.1 hypothetical protein [Acidimicrobiia bacterium]
MSDTNQPQPSPEQKPEPYDKVYALRILPGNGPIDPELAASLEKVFENADKDPDSFRNNPAKKKAALEGLGKLLEEWQAENGAFTEEELAWAHKTLYGE